MFKRSIIFLSVLLCACSGDVQVNEVGRVFQCVERDATLMAAGQLEYAEQCDSCHGEDGRTPLSGSRLLNPSNQFPYDTLLATIENTMPQGAPGLCTGDCAVNVTEYILGTWCDADLGSVSSSSVASSASSVASSSSSSTSSSASSVNGLEVNGDVESGLAPWVAVEGVETLSQSLAQANSGVASVYVINRTSVDQGAGQVIAGMRSGYDYQLSAMVRMDGQVQDNLRLRLLTRSVVNGVDVDEATTIAEASVANDWQALQGSVSLSVDGQLSQALVAVDGAAIGASFYVDDLLVIETGETDSSANELLIESGRLLFENTGCGNCHGSGINMGAIPQWNIDPNNLLHTTPDQMVTFITNRMPPAPQSPTSCGLACAEATAAYIQSWE